MAFELDMLEREIREAEALLHNDVAVIRTMGGESVFTNPP